MFRTITAAALLALTITAAQAASLTVRYGDLNLSNADDARILASRVQTAAEAACADWKPDRWQKNSFFVNRFYKNIYDSCVDTTSRRVNSRVMVKSVAHTAQVAGN